MSMADIMGELNAMAAQPELMSMEEVKAQAEAKKMDAFSMSKTDTSNGSTSSGKNGTISRARLEEMVKYSGCMELDAVLEKFDKSEFIAEYPELFSNNMTEKWKGQIIRALLKGVPAEKIKPFASEEYYNEIDEDIQEEPYDWFTCIIDGLLGGLTPNEVLREASPELSGTDPELLEDLIYEHGHYHSPED